MGQYYRVMNCDKRQFIVPHTFGDGLKLLEFGCSGNGTMTALAVLLAHGNNRGGGDLRSDNPIVGSWSGDRIVVGGDYDDVINEDIFKITGKLIFYDEDVIAKRQSQKKKHAYKNLYDITHNEGDWEDISFKVIEALIEDRYLADEFARCLSNGRFGVSEEWPIEIKLKLAAKAGEITRKAAKAAKDFEPIKEKIDMILKDTHLFTIDQLKIINGIIEGVERSLRFKEIPW